jgi:hypothetical protein
LVTILLHLAKRLLVVAVVVATEMDNKVEAQAVLVVVVDLKAQEVLALLDKVTMVEQVH